MTIIVSEKAKMWVALIVGLTITLLVAVQGALTDGITTNEWLTIGITFLGAILSAFGVYEQPNAPGSLPE